MRVADADVKKMVEKVNQIHTKVAVIEVKTTSMESHLKDQNGKLNDHDTKIGNLEIAQKGLDTKMWVMIFVAGSGGTIFGAVASSLIGGII